MRLDFIASLITRFHGTGQGDRTIADAYRQQRQQLNAGRVVLEDQARDAKANHKEAKRALADAQAAFDCTFKRRRIISGLMAQNTAKFAQLKELELKPKNRGNS